MEKTFKLETPTMPNFIKVSIPLTSNEHGFVNPTIDVSELSEEEANQYAELMKDTFIKHYYKRVKFAKSNTTKIR